MSALASSTGRRVFQPQKASGYWNLRLFIAALAAIVGHVFCFYVFQVQDAKVLRVLPETSHVTYLSQDDPSAFAVLRQLDDYYAAFDGALASNSSLTAPLPMVAAEVGKQRYYIDLMPSPFGVGSANKASNVLPVLPVLPQVAGAKVPSRNLRYSSSLRHRALSNQVDWVDDRTGVFVETAWRVAITPSGKVHHVFPLDGNAPAPALESLQRAIRSLRFQSASSLSELEWGTVTVTSKPDRP